MNYKEKLLDLKNRRKEAIDQAKGLVADGKLNTDEYKAVNGSIDSLGGQIKALEALLEMDGAEDPGDMTTKGLRRLPGTGLGEGGDPGEGEDVVKSFAAAARKGFVVAKDMSEGSNEDGGYTVPEDIVTRVERLRDTKVSLRELVSVEMVTTKSGRRTYKKRAQQTGFTKVAEGGKIPKGATPQFSVMSYEIAKYAGYTAVTNELLEDSDENITNALVEWLADEARATDNANILAAINGKASVAIEGLDGVKKTVLVDLNSAFRSTAKIVTNSNGVYWLSTLKDENGRDLLTPIPSEPGKMQLACGPVVVPVVEIPNDTLANPGENQIPIIVGDLKEGVRLFDRKQLTLTSSGVAVAGEFNAFEQDMTLTRGILRQDVKLRDEDAFIVGYIDITAAAG